MSPTSPVRPRRSSIRRIRACAAAAAPLAALGAVAIAAPTIAAPPGTAVAIIAHTDFSADESAFESTIDGCAVGTVTDAGGGARFTPWGGAFNGDKEFTCDGGDAGFTIRLHARFGADGSVGTWTMLDAWGELSGMKGSGSLVGLTTAIGIDDVYTGSLR